MRSPPDCAGLEHIDLATVSQRCASHSESPQYVSKRTSNDMTGKLFRSTSAQAITRHFVFGSSCFERSSAYPFKTALTYVFPKVAIATSRPISNPIIAVASSLINFLASLIRGEQPPLPPR
jgi:hypothetical protein